MSAITWDASGERSFETGVDHGVLYVRNSSGAYKPGVPWNGLTAVTESPSGAEATDLWADNIKYASFRSAETFGATVEAYTYPDEFAECDGSASPSTGVYIGQQSRKVFGLSYRTQVGNDTDVDLGNSGYKIHLIWGATASPSERAYETINDSPDAITFSWELATTPVAVTGYKPTASMVIDSTKFTTTEAKAKLKTLTDKLYGTDPAGSAQGTDPELPLPDAVIAIFAVEPDDAGGGGVG